MTSYVARVYFVRIVMFVTYFYRRTLRVALDYPWRLAVLEMPELNQLLYDWRVGRVPKPDTEDLLTLKAYDMACI